VNDLAIQLEGLQTDAMDLLLDVQKTVQSIERLTEQTHKTSTLYHHAQSTTETFARRAAGIQERATNRSSQLSARKIQLFLLTKRLDHLAFLAGDEQPPQLQRVKAALSETETLIRRWATDPATERSQNVPNKSEE
jgi:hypothetical protein